MIFWRPWTSSKVHSWCYTGSECSFRHSEPRSATKSTGIFLRQQWGRFAMANILLQRKTAAGHHWRRAIRSCTADHCFSAGLCAGSVCVSYLHITVVRYNSFTWLYTCHVCRWHAAICIYVWSNLVISLIHCQHARCEECIIWQIILYVYHTGMGSFLMASCQVHHWKSAFRDAPKKN